MNVTVRPPKLDRGGGRWNGRRDECRGIRHRARCQQKLHSCNKTNASPPFVAPLPRKCQLLHLLLRCRLSLCHCAPLVVAVFFCRLMPTCASCHAVTSHLPLNALQPPSNSCCEPLILVGSCVPSRHMFSACATVLHALFIASLTPHTFTSVFHSPVDQSRM